MPRSFSRAYGTSGDSAESRLLPFPEPDSSASGDRHRSLHVEGAATATGRTAWGWGKVAVVFLGFTAVTVAAVLRAGPSTPSAVVHGSVPENLEEIGVVPGGGGRPAVDDVTHPSPLSFTAVNYYHLRDGKPGQDYPWLKDVKLIEPHRETILSVANPREGFAYQWKIRGGETDELHTSAIGREAIVLLSRLDENMVTLEELDTDGAITRRLDEMVMVKYVRREIRTLTEDERGELFDAMSKLWRVRVKDGNGREIYGDKYSDIWAINRLHYKAASPRVCDHFHDGLGFLTNHAFLSNTFEHSLQMVNPMLTLPYWDFTIETSSAATGADGGGEGDESFSGISTPLMQPSWFGTSDPDDYMVKDGRWAYTEIPRMKENNPSGIEPDVYGKLRAPWNVNRRAYLTRGLGTMCGADMQEDYPWPTCEMHYDLVTSYSDFYSWVWGSMYDPHGPVHIWIGGVLDCEKTYIKIADLIGRAAAKQLARLSFVHRKDMFRSGFFWCEGNVDISEEADEIYSSGVCGCRDFNLTEGDDYLKIFKTMAFMEELVVDAPDDIKRELVSILCSSQVNDGDHLQASSSLDPSFWPTHPTMERLWMFSVLTGRVTDFTWPDADVTYTASDGTTYTESISIYSDECMGHRGSDVFPYSILDTDANDFTVQTGIKGNTVGGGNSLSNREALAAFDPRINALPYIYDTFKWPHCEADGVSMDDAWTEREASGARNADKEPASSHEAAAGARARDSAGGRTIFEEHAARFPMYGTLRAKLKELKNRIEVEG